MTTNSTTIFKTVTLPGGHTITFVHRDPNGSYALIEWMAPPDGSGPPPHIHRVTDEGFYVLEGTFGFLAGEETLHRSSGAYVFVPRGLAHTFWNDGPAPAKLLIVISPAGFEPYFAELSAGLAAAGDSVEASLRVRQALSAKYDVEVIGPPRLASAAR